MANSHELTERVRGVCGVCAVRVGTCTLSPKCALDGHPAVTRHIETVAGQDHPGVGIVEAV